MNFYRIHKRRAGQSLVELAAGLIVLIPVILMLLDLAVVIIAINVNDACCRDAARSAAAGPPVAIAGYDDIQSQTASRAQAVVARYAASTGGYIQAQGGGNAIRLVDAPAADLPTLPAGQVRTNLATGVYLATNPATQPTFPFGGPFIGTVTVRTQVSIRLPATIAFVGLPEFLLMNSQQTFPITYTYPNRSTPL